MEQTGYRLFVYFQKRVITRWKPCNIFWSSPLKPKHSLKRHGYHRCPPKRLSIAKSNGKKQRKRYLEQLCADNNPLIGEYTTQRIDGTNFTYQFHNNEGKETFSVKVAFFVNEKKMFYIQFLHFKKIRYYEKRPLLRRRCSELSDHR